MLWKNQFVFLVLKWFSVCGCVTHCIFTIYSSGGCQLFIPDHECTRLPLPEFEYSTSELPPHEPTGHHDEEETEEEGAQEFT